MVKYLSDDFKLIKLEEKNLKFGKPHSMKAKKVKWLKLQGKKSK
jgi:hypothetical protein